MKTLQRGFTIVELLIVIVVLGVLLSIVTVAWAQYINSSQDSARETETIAWSNTFDLYKSRFFVYPVMPTDKDHPGIACLGGVDSFPTATNLTGGNKCGQYKSSDASAYASTSAAFDTAIKKVGYIQHNSSEQSRQNIIDDTVVGPLVHVSRPADTGTFLVTARLVNFFKGDCPTGFLGPVTNFNTTLPGLDNLLPSGSSAKVCYIEKTFSFTAS